MSWRYQLTVVVEGIHDPMLRSYRLSVRRWSCNIRDRNIFRTGGYNMQCGGGVVAAPLGLPRLLRLGSSEYECCAMTHKSVQSLCNPTDTKIQRQSWNLRGKN